MKKRVLALIAVTALAAQDNQGGCISSSPRRDFRAGKTDFGRAGIYLGGTDF